jgi:hypothetical protein
MLAANILLSTIMSSTGAYIKLAVWMCIAHISLSQASFSMFYDNFSAYDDSYAEAIPLELLASFPHIIQYEPSSPCSSEDLSASNLMAI